MKIFLILAIPLSLYGQVGINTVSPTETLHVNGTFRLENGTEGTNKVLTSDATGVATWQNPQIQIVEGVLGSGVNISYNNANFLQTGSQITLPPGRFVVNIIMLLTTGSNSPNNSFIWLRSSFSDSSAGSPTISSDIVGSQLASGSHIGPSRYNILTGYIIIENSSNSNKTYHYIAGASTESTNTSQTFSSFGGTTWGENNIIAYRVQ